MYLLYLDDSGSVQNPADTYIVLAGIAVFERQPHWLSTQLDAIAARAWPDNPQALEFRGSDILSGRKHWRGIEKSQRLSLYADALRLIQKSHTMRLFGAAIHKAAILPNDPMEYAFEQMCNRFDRFLGRLHSANNTQRGLIIIDKSSYETSLQKLAINFRTHGHRWGKLYNLCDVPLFVDSQATRMIQLSDLVAHAIRRFYEQNDPYFFDMIAPHFDAFGPANHGLVHKTLPDDPCLCMSCRSR